MYCRECGTENEDNAKICRGCNTILIEETGGLSGSHGFKSCSDQTVGLIILLVGIVLGISAVVPFFILETKELITLERMRLIVSLPLIFIAISFIAIGWVIHYGCRRRNTELHKAEEDYRALVENAGDGIFTIDQGGRFTFLNDAALKIGGYTGDELVGKNFFTVIAPEYREATIENFRKREVGKASDRYVIEVLTKDGKRKRVELSLKTLEHKGEFMGVEGIAREVVDTGNFAKERGEKI